MILDNRLRGNYKVVEKKIYVGRVWIGKVLLDKFMLI